MKTLNARCSTWALRFSKILILFTSVSATAQTESPVSFQRAILELTDVSSLPSYLANTRCALVSSYDTTGGNDDGFSGKYSYLRRNTDSSLVIFDVKGPGMINRIWTPTPSEDSLDFYIDNLSRPAFTIRYRDLFTGKVFPFVGPLCGNQLGGFYCYLPIPFQERCKIVFRGKRTQFHQIQYRQYPDGTSVQKFKLPLTKEEGEVLESLKTPWNKEESTSAHFYIGVKTAQVQKQNIQLTPGQSIIAWKADKGGRILSIELDPAALFEGVAKQVDIRITWDNEKTPAVFCPVADFFGFAFGKASMKSLLIGSRGRRAYCYFPMPFDKAATVEFVYRNSEASNPSPVTFTCTVLHSSVGRDPAKEGKFYAHWTRNNPAALHQPHVLLQTNGKGHLVGTVLQAQGLKSGMTYFFEGDDSTVIDGELRMHGTGSEDYFNGGWYALPDRWDAAMSLPLSGALDYSLPFCRTGGFRLFLSDKISFEKGIHHSIEHGPVGNASPVDYTSVAYYYNSTPPIPAVAPTNATTRVFLPDTLMLYPQLMNLGIVGEIAIRPDWAYPTGGETFFCTVTNNSSIRIPLQSIPTGDYKLYLDYALGPEGCSFSIWQRQTQLSDWKDCYKAAKEREGQYLTTIHVDALINTITIRFQASAKRNQFVLNRLILIRK